MTINAAQSRAARGLIGWSQADLAAASKVARATIADFESSKRDPYPRTLDDMRRAFEAAGVIFVEENGEGPGVRLKKNKQPIYVDARQPASTHHANVQAAFLTLQEAVLAWYRLPPALRETTSISIEGGIRYKEAEILRLHYGQPSGPATDVVDMMDAAIEDHETKRKS